MKKVLAMILCLTMLLSVASVMAFAADEVTIVEAELIDPGKEYNDDPKYIFDGNFGTAVTYSWNDVNAVRAAVLELESASTLENCNITWGNPSWEAYDMVAVDYSISVSTDGVDYTEIYKVTGLEGLGKGRQRTDTITFDTPAENVHFVKITVTKAAGFYLGLCEVRFNKNQSSSQTSSKAESSVAATSSAAASSEVTSSSEEPSSVAETSSEAVVSEEPSSVAETSSVAESSAATTDNEPKSMTWLWIVIAAVAVAAIVVIVLASKKKK